MFSLGHSLHRRRTALLLVALVAMLALLMVLAWPDVAFGRAGGGQGYHGSGSSPSGSHSSGSGGEGADIGPFIFWIVQFCIHYPYIAVPLIAIGVYLFYKASQQGADTYQTSVIRRAGGQAAEARRAAALERLRSTDPAFDEAAFCARARDAFLRLQQAWSAQDLAPVRPFVSDGIYERFSLQFAEQRDFNYRNQMDRIEVLEVRLVQVAGDSFFDLLSVAIQARADDYRVALDTGKRRSDGGTTEPFVEYWTFLRRQGVKSGDKPGLIEGHCPNCGAEITLNESARCNSCSSLVRSGNFDWVLCEITQAVEWNDDELPDPDGVGEYRRQHDPGFNVEHLEDRASVIFWRQAMADRLGDVRPLMKMALPEFCEDYPKRWAVERGVRCYWGDCAVGSVATIGLLPGEPMDRVLLEVRWAGRMFAVRSPEKPQPAGDNALFRTLFVLYRKPGVQSAVETSVTSAHCPNCGAPPSDVTANACEFCDAVLNDGGYDWVLGGVYSIPSDEATALIDELSSQATQVEALSDDAAVPVGGGMAEAAAPRGSELLAWAIQMALADQELSDKERQALERAALRRGVAAPRLEAMIDAAQRGQLAAPQPRDLDEGRKWLAAMADMALADGRVEPAEAEFLGQAGEQLGWSRADVKQLLAQRKSRLYQAAREQLRQKKNGQA